MFLILFLSKPNVHGNPKPNIHVIHIYDVSC